MTDVRETWRSKADSSQVMMTREFVRALHEVGILPDGVYTAPGTTRLVLHDGGTPGMVGLETEILVPLDKLRRALDLVAERRAPTTA